MNKQELRELVVEYAKRSDFSAAVFDRWVTFTNIRIGRWLRGQDNIETMTVTPTPLPYLLPFHCRALRSVEGVSGNATYRLQSVEAFANVVSVAGGGTPMVYRVNGFEFEVRPFQAVPLTLRFWSEPASLLADTDTNAVLTAQPMLYLYGVLFELSVWASDREAAAGHMQVFLAEIEQLNGQGASLVDTPVMGV